VRTTFERIRDSLGKLGAGMNHVVSIKTYLTDLGPYAVFSRIRGEFFPKDPPTSTAVQVAGLLLNAKIEIDAVAFLPAGLLAEYRARPPGTVGRPPRGRDFQRQYNRKPARCQQWCLASRSPTHCTP
jgi:hypothetical protein